MYFCCSLIGYVNKVCDFTQLLNIACLFQNDEFFGQELEEMLQGQPNTYYNPEVIRLAYWTKELNMDNDPKAFFSDGVHPSGLTYQTWGEDFGRFILREVYGQ